MAAKTPSAIGRPPKRHVSTVRPTDTVLDDLFAELDAVQKRLVAAQDEEQAKLPPIDWDTAQQELAEERAKLLITAGQAVDEMMHLAELGVGVARQVAGVEAAARMAGAQSAPQPALPRPPDPFDGGDDTEDFHEIRAANTAPIHGGVWDENWNWAAPTEPPKLTLATRVGGWWQRTRQRARHAYARVVVGVGVAAGLSWGIG